MPHERIHPMPITSLEQAGDFASKLADRLENEDYLHVQASSKEIGALARSVALLVAEIKGKPRCDATGPATGPEVVNIPLSDSRRKSVGLSSAK